MPKINSFKKLGFIGFSFIKIVNSKETTPLGKIRYKNVIRRHDETRRRNDLGNWLYMNVSRTSFYVATFSRHCDNVVYVAMSSQRFYDVRDVKRRPEYFYIQPNIQVLSTSGFDGRRIAEWDKLHMHHKLPSDLYVDNFTNNNFPIKQFLRIIAKYCHTFLDHTEI